VRWQALQKERRRLEELVPEVQERLGTINDHATAITLLTNMMGSADRNGRQTAFGQLVRDEQAQLDDSRECFLNWWTVERAAALADKVRAAIEPGQRMKQFTTTALREPKTNKSISSVG